MAEAPQRTVFAQGKLDARYVVTLSGLPIGRGTWVIDIGEDYFTAAASGDTLVPQACQRTLSIFDGRMRYDLQLAFKRLDRVSSDRGYQGLAVVCAVSFSPIAGHVPERYAIKYLIQLRDMELWLAPIAGTRVMVPFRVSVPTPIGLGVMQATQFLSVAQPGNATAKAQ